MRTARFFVLRQEQSPQMPPLLQKNINKKLMSKGGIAAGNSVVCQPRAKCVLLLDSLLFVNFRRGSSACVRGRCDLSMRTA
jgi:hypothetical protein